MKNIISILLSFFCLFSLYAQSEYRFIESATDSIFYEITGSGKPVLFLSGGPGGSPESLRPIFNYVSKDHHAILMHQRGTGLSSNNRIDAETITLDQYIEDIDHILEKEHIDSLYIIGHSWGAMLGLDYMVKNPSKVKGLILIGSSGYALDFVQSMNGEIFKRMTPAEMDSLNVYFKQLKASEDAFLETAILNKLNVLTLSKQFYDPSLLGELLWAGPLNMQVNEIMMKDLTKRKWNLEKELKKLNHPVVIINGDFDPIGKEYVLNLKKALKNSKLHFLENSGHYVWIEKPDELQVIIEEFLSEN